MRARRCLARNRSGAYCMRWAVRGKKRCKLHGGTNVGGQGPHDLTAARIAVAKSQALRKALGLPWHGGHPFKREKVEKMVEEAKQVLVPLIEAAADDTGVYGDVEHVEQMPTPQLLRAASHKALVRLYEVLSIPIDKDMDVKLLRVIGERAHGVLTLHLRAADMEFRERRNDARDELLRRLADGTEGKD